MLKWDLAISASSHQRYFTAAKNSPPVHFIRSFRASLLCFDSIAIKSSTLGLYAVLLLTMETRVNSIFEGCLSQCNTSTKHIATPDWWRGDAGLLSVTSNLWREGLKRSQVISILYRDGKPTANRSKWISINRLSEKRGVLDLSCNDILVLGDGQQLFLSKCWLCHTLEHIYTVQNVWHSFEMQYK